MANKKDILEFLHADHEKVAELLERLDATQEGDTRKRKTLFNELKHDLLSHSEAEQAAFYEPLMQSQEAEEIVREGIEEHKVVKRLLSELDSMDFANEQWGAKLAVLKENVEHHVKEEEDEMFDKARDFFEDDELREMAENFQSHKRRKKAA